MISGAYDYTIIMQNSTFQGYIFWPFPKLKNRGEFEGKKEGKRGEKKKTEKSYKTHVKIPL